MVGVFLMNEDGDELFDMADEIEHDIMFGDA